MKLIARAGWAVSIGPALAAQVLLVAGVMMLIPSTRRRAGAVADRALPVLLLVRPRPGPVLVARPPAPGLAVVPSGAPRLSLVPAPVPSGVVGRCRVCRSDIVAGRGCESCGALPSRAG